MENLNEFKGASKSKRNDSYGSPQALIFDLLLQVAHLPGDGFDSLSDDEIIPFSDASKLEAGCITPARYAVSMASQSGFVITTPLLCC